MIKPPNIVRETFVISNKFGKLDKNWVNLKIKETKKYALQIAKRIGIQSPDIQDFFDLYVGHGIDYPMWLLGEGAKRLKTWEEWLCIGPCKYTVVIREKE